MNKNPDIKEQNMHKKLSSSSSFLIGEIFSCIKDDVKSIKNCKLEIIFFCERANYEDDDEESR